MGKLGTLKHGSCVQVASFGLYYFGKFIIHMDINESSSMIASTVSFGLWRRDRVSNVLLMLVPFMPTHGLGDWMDAPKDVTLTLQVPLKSELTEVSSLCAVCIHRFLYRSSPLPLLLEDIPRTPAEYS